MHIKQGTQKQRELQRVVDEAGRFASLLEKTAEHAASSPPPPSSSKAAFPSGTATSTGKKRAPSVKPVRAKETFGLAQGLKDKRATKAVFDSDALKVDTTAPSTVTRVRPTAFERLPPQQQQPKRSRRRTTSDSASASTGPGAPATRTRRTLKPRGPPQQKRPQRPSFDIKHPEDDLEPAPAFVPKPESITLQSLLASSRPATSPPTTQPLQKPRKAPEQAQEAVSILSRNASVSQRQKQRFVTTVSKMLK